jgi:hypothetical protein
LLGDERLAGLPAFQAFAAVHATSLAHYREMRWDEAERELDANDAAATGFGLAKLYARYRNSIHAFRAHPPSDDWEGIAVAETK